MKFDDHFVSWVFIYSIGAWFSITLLNYFSLLNSLVGIFVAGLIITLITWIMYSLLYHNQFVLNKWFFLWFFLHSFNFWWIDLVLRKLTLTYQGFLYFLAFGLVFHLITWIIKHKIFYKINMNTSKTIISIVLLVCIILFVSAQPFSEISSTGFSNNSGFGSILNSLTLSSFKLGNSCPQLNVLLLHNRELGSYISNAGDINSLQQGWKISVYNVAEMFSIRTDFVFCNAGRSEGEVQIIFTVILAVLQAEFHT